MAPQSVFELPIAGFSVRDLAFAGPVTIGLQHEHGARMSIMLEGPFKLEPPDGDYEVVDPQSPEDVTSLLGLRDIKIRSGSVGLDGTLTVAFADGRTLVAGPAFNAPSWRLMGTEFQLTARAGGGIEIHPHATPGGAT